MLIIKSFHPKSNNNFIYFQDNKPSTLCYILISFNYFSRNILSTFLLQNILRAVTE